jgi:ribosomal protein S18 acetylase RimI-like enzyme
MEITKYNSEHEESLLAAITKDVNWDMFTNDEAIDAYKEALNNSVTYVCHNNQNFCGYLRAILDSGFAIYVSELYVVPECRNNQVGRTLLERVQKDFSDLDVYALSDEDSYYEKIGYKKIGSVFQLL